MSRNLATIVLDALAASGALDNRLINVQSTGFQMRCERNPDDPTLPGDGIELLGQARKKVPEAKRAILTQAIREVTAMITGGAR